MRRKNPEIAVRMMRKLSRRGEVACIGPLRLPIRRVLLSTGPIESKAAFLASARDLAAAGVEFYGTGGTATFMADSGIPVTQVHWPLDRDQAPNAVDLIRDAEVDLVVKHPQERHRGRADQRLHDPRRGHGPRGTAHHQHPAGAGLARALCRKSRESRKVRSWQKD